MLSYTTTFKLKNGMKGNYKTKTLTEYHKGIHTSNGTLSATTVENDHGVKDFPLGLYSEVIATSKAGKFTKEFTREFVVKKVKKK